MPPDVAALGDSRCRARNDPGMPALPAPRKHLHRWEFAGTTRFLTFSCYHGLQLFKTAALRDLFVDAFAMARVKHRFRLVAWVVMPEHAHIFIVPRPVIGIERGVVMLASESTADEILFTLKCSVAQRALNRWIELEAPVLRHLRRSGGGHHFWQAGGGFDRNTRDDNEHAQTVAYIHQNPVKRGLAEVETDWPWSSARWYADDERGPLLECDLGRGGRGWAPPADWIAGAVPQKQPR